MGQASISDSIAQLARRGDFTAVNAFVSGSPPSTWREPPLAIKLARIRAAQGYVREALRLLDTADRGRASAGELLLIDIESACMRFYIDADIATAMDRCRQLLTGLPAGITPADRADATRLAARLGQIARHYFEIGESEGTGWRERLRDATATLQQAGRLDEALDAHLNEANWPHQPADLRLARLLEVARMAREWGLPARAAAAHLERASIMTGAGTSPASIKPELAQAEADYAAARHKTGPLEIARVRDGARVRRREAPPALLDELLKELDRADTPRQVLSALLDLSQVAHEQGRLADAIRHYDSIADLSQQVGLEFMRMPQDLAAADIFMRTRRLTEAIKLCRSGLARPAPRLFHANYRQFLATAYGFAGDRVRAIQEGEAALAAYEAIGAEETASIAAGKLASDVAGTRTADAYARANEILSHWLQRDLARDDAEAACRKLEILGRFACDRFALAPLQERDARFLDEAERHVAAAETLARRLEPKAAARHLGNLDQTKASIRHARGIAGEPEAGFLSAISHYAAGGLEMEVANSHYIVGVARLNSAADALRAGEAAAGLEHARTAETHLAAALDYYARSGMRAEGPQARLMLAQLYVNAAAAFSRERRSLCDSALALLKMGFDDLQAARQEYALGDVLETRTGKLSFAKSAQAIVDLALQILISDGDAAEAWNWAQRGKSRAILDLLHRAGHPPAAMVSRLKAEPELAALLDEETRLRDDLKGLLTDTQRGALSTRLHEILAKMGAHPAGADYADYADYRAGSALTARLNGLLC